MNELSLSRKPAARSGGLLALFLLAGLPALVTPLRADNPPAFLFQWGSQGTGNGQFNYSWGIAVDSSNNVYVADNVNSRIEKFTSNGAYLTQWGGVGNGNGQFSEPTGIAVDSSHNVYVVDSGNSRIEKFTGNGAYLTQWGSQGNGNGQFDNPFFIAVDSSNNVYVTDDFNDRVEKFDGNGNYLTQWGGVGSGNGQFNSPEGIAVDSSHNVYVVDSANNRIEKFDNNANYLTQWGGAGNGNGQFSGPTGIAVDAGNHVYVTDDFNYRIEKFDGGGNYLTQWEGFNGGNGPSYIPPECIALDGSGNFVYVTYPSYDFIQVFAHNTTQIQPYITNQPVSQNVVAGDNVAFSVAAVGAAPFTYQWMSNNVALPDATNSALNLTNVNLSVSGDIFTIVVTNAFGGALSSNAVLTVVPALATTLPASGISVTSAVLNGYVTVGEDTVVWFNWGTDTNYGEIAGTTELTGGSGSGSNDLSATLDGLAANYYHYQIVASNISGVVYGSDESFAVGLAPTVTTLSPVSTTNSATLNASVNPEGWDTKVYFAWGLDRLVNNSTPPTDIGAGTISVNISSLITGLTPDSSFSCEIIASNSLGITYGAIVNSATLLPPPFSSAPLRSWQSVASSADGSKLVAAASGVYGAPGGIYISTNNGATWNSASSPAIISNAPWELVATSADGVRLIATFMGSPSIYISTNSGTTFSETPFAQGVRFPNCTSLVSSADGSKLVAVSQTSLTIYISTNSGVTWVSHNGFSTQPSYVASSADGVRLLASANGFYVSTNGGVNWTQATNAPTGRWSSVASSANGYQLLACSYPGNVYISTNAGVDWAQTMLPTNNWTSVAESADGTKAVALANSASATYGVGKGGIWTSTDSGNTWISNNVSSASWTCAAMSADGNEFVASMGYPSTAGGIYVSQTTPAPVLNLPASDNTLISWIVPSLSFSLQQSSDLSNWTDMTNVPVLNFTNLENQVALPSSIGSSFFRLKH